MQTIRINKAQTTQAKPPYQLALENHLINTRKQALITLIEQLEAFLKQTTAWYRKDRDATSKTTLKSIKTEIENGAYDSSNTRNVITKIMQDRYFYPGNNALPYISALSAIENSCALPSPDEQKDEENLKTSSSLYTELAQDTSGNIEKEIAPTGSPFSCLFSIFNSQRKTIPLNEPLSDTEDSDSSAQSKTQKEANKIFNGQLARQLVNIVEQWEAIKKQEKASTPLERLKLITTIKTLENDIHLEKTPKDFIKNLLGLKNELMQKSSISCANFISSNRLYRMLEIGFPYTDQQLQKKHDESTKPYFYEALQTVQEELCTQEINKTDKIVKLNNLSQLAAFLTNLISTEKTGMTADDLKTFSTTLLNEKRSSQERNIALASLTQQVKNSLTPAANLSTSQSDSALFTNSANNRSRTGSAPNAGQQSPPIKINNQFAKFLAASLSHDPHRLGRLAYRQKEGKTCYLTGNLSNDHHVISVMTEFDGLIQKTKSPQDREFYYSTMLLFLYARSKVLDEDRDKDPTLECSRAIFKMILSVVSPKSLTNFFMPDTTEQNHIDIKAQGKDLLGCKNNFGKIVDLVDDKFLAQSTNFPNTKISSQDFFSMLMQGTVPDNSVYLGCR